MLVYDDVAGIDCFVDLITELNAKELENLDAKVWDIAKQYDNMPDFNNIYIEVVFEELIKTLTDKYPDLGLEITYYINGEDSHFYVNNEEMFDDIDTREFIKKVEDEQVFDTVNKLKN